jgi:Flp pilus assembly pilin Flp
LLKDLFKEESGTNAVEYGLLMALIVVVLIGAIQAFGDAVNGSLFTVAAKIFP